MLDPIAILKYNMWKWNTWKFALQAWSTINFWVENTVISDLSSEIKEKFEI